MLDLFSHLTQTFSEEQFTDKMMTECYLKATGQDKVDTMLYIMWLESKVRPYDLLPYPLVSDTYKNDAVAHSNTAVAG